MMAATRERIFFGADDIYSAPVGGSKNETPHTHLWAHDRGAAPRLSASTSDKGHGGTGRHGRTAISQATLLRSVPRLVVTRHGRFLRLS